MTARSRREVIGNHGRQFEIALGSGGLEIVQLDIRAIRNVRVIGDDLHCAAALGK